MKKPMPRKGVEYWVVDGDRIVQKSLYGISPISMDDFFAFHKINGMPFGDYKVYEVRRVERKKKSENKS